MTRRGGLLLAGVLACAAACTSSADGPGDAAETGSALTRPASELPAPAGESEARRLAGLPAGPASGTVVLSYIGVGELRSAFTGSCAHPDGVTEITGTADTARVDVRSGPSGTQVMLDDEGLTTTSELAEGTYGVEDGHLSLSAPLLQSDQVVGSVQLEIDCAG